MKRRYVSLFLWLITFLFLFSSPISAYTGNGGTTVYITEHGGRYHAISCGYLNKSCISISLEDAIIDGYTRCTVCNPPRYTGSAKPGDSRKVSSGNNSNSENHNFTQKSSEYSPDLSVSEIASTPPINRSDSSNTSNSSNNILFYIAGSLILCLLAYCTSSHFFKKTVLYKKILLKQRKKQLYEDVSIFLLRYQKYMKFRSSPQYATLCKIHKDKCSRLKLLLSAHDCEFGEDGKLRNKNSVIGYGKDFTIHRGSSCYHSPNCQYALGLYIHLLERSYRLRPCSKCRPPIQKPWMQECVNLRNEISEIEHVIYFPLAEDKSTTRTPLSILRDLCRIQEKLHQQVSRKIR